MYNVQVDNQIHKIKFDSQFLLNFANTILSQLPRTCFAVLVQYYNISRTIWMIKCLKIVTYAFYGS